MSATKTTNLASWPFHFFWGYDSGGGSNVVKRQRLKEIDKDLLYDIEAIFSVYNYSGEVSTPEYRNVEDLQFRLNFGDLGL